jgi:PAS domain S-box-containing protein
MTDRVLTEARERARHLAVIVADETGVVQSWSDGAAALFGYGASDAVGRTVADLIVPPTFLPQHEQGLRRFAARKDSGRLGGSFTMLARDAAGSHFPIDLAVFALELPHTRWMLGVARPLGEATPANILSDDVIATVFERAPEAITLLDPRGRQISVNAAGAQMVGLGDEGRYPGDGRGFIHPDDRDRTARHFADVLTGAAPADSPCRYRVITSDGSWIWLETVLADLVDVPAIGGFVGFSRNVTEDEQRRIELDAAYLAAQEARDQLRRLADARLAFAASTSHELRTPLSSISSAVEALLSEPPNAFSPHHRNYLDLIGRNSLRLARLVEDLLAYSRLEAGQLAPRREPVDPLQVVHDVVAQLDHEAERRGQCISLTLDDGPLMTGDEDQVRQVVENVVANAVKFADPDSTIDVACDHGPGGWLITVTNVGPSIEPADADRMFEPFVRVGATEHTTPGSGLGLPLARGLAELHGGSLTWDSGFTSGTRFRIVLPTV